MKGKLARDFNIFVKEEMQTTDEEKAVKLEAIRASNVFDAYDHQLSATAI